jgi:3-oxoacyl-[acyl-carrier protein] reductase
MDLGIRNRVAIVAAASQGLGKAAALALAKEGARLAICSRNQETLAAAAAEIRDAGAEVLEQVTDVTDAGQVRSFVEATVARFGQVDICVTNAGGPPSKTFDQTTTSDWQAAVQLNFMSTLFFAQEVLPKMKEQRWGRFITVTSVSVKQPLDGLILSNSVRAAVSGLVKSLANEFGPYNVLVKNICPGFTATARLTNMAKKNAEAEGIPQAQVEERWTNQVPLRRLGRPEEFADLVAFLASERATYITGTSIAVDGGFIKGLY